MFTTRFLDLPPLRGVGGTVRLPGSKSISNRVLLLAGLRRGHDDDPRPARLRRHARDARGAAPLGCGDRRRRRAARASPASARARSAHAGDALPRQRRHGDAAAGRRAGGARGAAGRRFELRGVPRMHERPIGDLVDALRQLGCAIDYLGSAGFPPLRWRDAPAPLALDAPIRVRGDVSSQFLTALLLALPLAPAPRGAVVEVDGELISKPYVEITLNLLARFGVAVAARRLAALHHPRRQRAALAGRASRRGRRLVGVVLHRRRRDRRERARRCASKASAATRSRATSASSTPRARWARRSTTGANWLEVRRGALAAARRSRSTATTSPTRR